MEANGADMWENNSGSEENGVQETECEMEISPNGAKQWIPTANPEETPYTGQKFKTVDEGIEFYKAYVKAVGFDVRHGTMRKTRGGEVAIKYMVCSREGFKPAAKEKNSQKECEGSFPETKTPLHMEQQAATLYTINMFYEFQTEIWEGSFTCHIIHKKDSIDARTYTVQEKGGKAFDVTMHTNGEKIECTCKKFIRVGILCRHALLVFNSEGVEEIPGEYIVPRWTRDACVRPMHNIWWAKGVNTQADNEAQSLANQLWNEFYNCMGLVNGWQEKMNEMLTTLQQLKKEFHKSKLQTNQSPASESAIEAIVGSRTTGEIRIKPPKFAHNKGSGKRLKSNKEKAIEKSKRNQGRVQHAVEKDITAEPA
nr:protein FAR1-RELATED SEQUENCE 5-like [Ipomoea batatas]